MDNENLTSELSLTSPLPAAAEEKQSCNIITTTAINDLMQLRPDVTFEFSDQNKDFYKCSVKIDDRTFNGTGLRKEKARWNAAKLALEYVREQKTAVQEDDQLTKSHGAPQHCAETNEKSKVSSLFSIENILKRYGTNDSSAKSTENDLLIAKCIQTSVINKKQNGSQAKDLKNSLNDSLPDLASTTNSISNGYSNSLNDSSVDLNFNEKEDSITSDEAINNNIEVVSELPNDIFNGISSSSTKDSTCKHSIQSILNKYGSTDLNANNSDSKPNQLLTEFINKKIRLNSLQSNKSKGNVNEEKSEQTVQSANRDRKLDDHSSSGSSVKSNLNNVSNSNRSSSATTSPVGSSTNLNKRNFDQHNASKILKQLMPSIFFEDVNKFGPRNSLVFGVKCVVDGKSFYGHGVGKRDAKNNAAELVLKEKFNLVFDYDQVNEVQYSSTNVAVNHKSLPNNYGHDFAKEVKNLVQDRFTYLASKSCILDNEERKVLAGVVMTKKRQMAHDEATVVALATGTKCINGEFLSTLGAVVNDSHAEIIVKRCLMDFFYNELKSFVENPNRNQSIFEKVGNFKCYQVKAGIKFHLFVSKTPCGDSCFPGNKNNVNVGKLRAKTEYSEGTDLLRPNEGIQTFDAISVLGNRLRTMSCSDKMLRWNVVGVQGALLSSLIKPVYFETVTIGNICEKSDLDRAITKRIAPFLTDVMEPYRLNSPYLLSISLPRVFNEAPKYSTNWTYGMEMLEIMDPQKGRTLEKKISRLAKRQFFARYHCLVKRIPNFPEENIKYNYFQQKKECRSYQINKKLLEDALVKGKLGVWMKKPYDLDRFENA